MPKPDPPVRRSTGFIPATPANDFVRARRRGARGAAQAGAAAPAALSDTSAS
jgi:hypothetical protein